MKGNDKEKVIDLIEQCLAFRLNTQETLKFLEKNKIKISDRTLRRLKQDINKKNDSYMIDIFRARVIDNFHQDVFSAEEMQKQGWKTFNDAITPREKIQALNFVRNASDYKMKLYFNVPWMFRKEQDGEIKKKKEAEAKLGKLKN